MARDSDTRRFPGPFPAQSSHRSTPFSSPCLWKARARGGGAGATRVALQPAVRGIEWGDVRGLSALAEVLMAEFGRCGRPVLVASRSVATGSGASLRAALPGHAGCGALDGVAPGGAAHMASTRRIPGPVRARLPHPKHGARHRDRNTVGPADAGPDGVGPPECRWRRDDHRAVDVLVGPGGISDSSSPSGHLRSVCRLAHGPGWWGRRIFRCYGCARARAGWPNRWSLFSRCPGLECRAGGGRCRRGALPRGAPALRSDVDANFHGRYPHRNALGVALSGNPTDDAAHPRPGNGHRGRVQARVGEADSWDRGRWSATESRHVRGRHHGPGLDTRLGFSERDRARRGASCGAPPRKGAHACPGRAGCG